MKFNCSFSIAASCSILFYRWIFMAGIVYVILFHIGYEDTIGKRKISYFSLGMILGVSIHSTSQSRSSSQLRHIIPPVGN